MTPVGIFVTGAVWGALAWALACFIGAALKQAAKVADENLDDDSDDGLACPNWDCDACTAELEASISRHPASRKSIQDPVTGRVWWL